MKYFAWESEVLDEDVITLGQIDQGPSPDSWQTGADLSRFMTEQTSIAFNKMFDSGTVWLDQLTNSLGLPIVNLDFLKFFKTLNLPDVDYYPIAVVDHNQKFQKEFFIIHPRKVIEIIDKENSDLAFSRIEPEEIVGVYDIQLVDDLGNKFPKIFRPQYWSSNVFVSEDIVDKITARGFQGVDFVPLDDEYLR